MKVFIINAGQKFGNAGGLFNDTITNITRQFCAEVGHEVRLTHIASGYTPLVEVENFLWADVIIYHTPIWWFNLPYEFVKYIDVVFSEGYGKIYNNDGRGADNTSEGYGNGGLLQGRRYMLTTTWNAPYEAFTEVDGFFSERGVDDSVMFGFHRTNAFLGLYPMKGMHFYNVVRNPDVTRWMKLYKEHLVRDFK